MMRKRINVASCGMEGGTWKLHVEGAFLSCRACELSLDPDLEQVRRKARLMLRIDDFAEGTPSILEF
jgi:hypothetical protein